MPVILGTAGHIDHGKTTLVRALTGIDCDRLAEEKQRGITIELGFAHLDLPSGARLGIVDVPGHEKFVKNMVAGAAGIDLVLLVVAADEGVMPQTREHLEICSLLGVRHGLVVLTKVDAVDAEMLELAREDVASFVAGTFLADAPVLPVSAATGAGLDRLVAALDGLAGRVESRREGGLFRLPVDRAFTIKGHGTVITGTMIGGRLALGEDVSIYPEGRLARVRGLQSHGEEVKLAPAGRRTAVNLHGIDLDDVRRGDVLARPDTLFPSDTWEIELTCLASSPRPLRHRTEAHFHHLAGETLARIYLLDRDKLVPGETAMVQVRFSEPRVAVFGDRVVLRSFSPLRTVGGGMVVGPWAGRMKRFSSAVDILRALARAAPEDRVRLCLERAGSDGLDMARLEVAAGLAPARLEKALSALGGRQEALRFDKENGAYVSGRALDELAESLAGHLERTHARDPMKTGVSRAELASAWGRALSPRLLHFLLERLLRQGVIVQEGDLLRLPGHKVTLASDQSELRRAILAAFEAGGQTPPALKTVLAGLGVNAKEAAGVLRLLQERGELVKVGQDMFFAAAAFEELVGKVRAFFVDHEELSPADLKETTGLSRKYAIPFIEHLDKEKITVRVGDVRRLRKAVSAAKDATAP